MSNFVAGQVLKAADLNSAFAAVTGVTSFNTRTGAVTLSGADVTGAGGALLASPAFTGTPTAPTAPVSTNTTQVATTAFVAAAVTSGTSGVISFNTRAGAVTLSSADITGAGGSPAASPTFTGTVTMPAWQFGINYQQYTQGATSIFRYASGGATQTLIFQNSGQGEVLKLIDPTSGVFPAANYLQIHNANTGNPVVIDTGGTDTNRSIILTPAGTGTVQAPTAAPGTSTTQLATTAFVAAAVVGGGGGIPEAPTNSQLYGRINASWQVVPGATAINVNSLTTTPLVGDGVTSNLTAWQNISNNLYNLNNEWPVSVTLTNGTPCIVGSWLDPKGNVIAHNLKPNQAFKFALASGGTLPTGITAGTIYFVTAANLTANTFTFSTVNNGVVSAGVAEGVPVNTTGTSSGVQVVLVSTDWINLYVPPGTYATNPPFGNASTRTMVNLFQAGISRVRLLAYGAVFDDLMVPTPSGSSAGYNSLPGPAPNGWLINYFDYIQSTQNIHSGPASTYNVTLKVIANASNYYPGMWIAIFGLDLMNDYGKETSGPPDNHYFEYNQVLTVNTGTGVLGLKYPFKFAYSDTFPNMWNGTSGAAGWVGGAIGGGPALIAPMSPSWDMEYEIHGARFPIAMPGFSGRRQVFLDCTFDRYFAPTIGREIICRRCTFPSIVTGTNYVEIDKMMEYLEFDQCEGILTFYSTSLMQCLVKKHRGRINNTPRNITIEDSIIELFYIGCIELGCTDSATILNSRFGFFSYAGRNDDVGTGAQNYGNSILANWTFSNGTFSRDLSTVPQASTYQPWAIPGAKFYLSDEAGQYDNMGCPFSILNVFMGGSTIGNASVVSGGSGGTSGTATLTVQGGTGTAATLSGTITSGALTGVSILTVGSYTTLPSNPAAVTGGGLSGATVFVSGSVFKFDTTLKALPTYQATISPVTVTIASPAVFTVPGTATSPSNGTPILLQTTGVLPTGFSAFTTVYFVVSSSASLGGTFQLSATSGGGSIASSGTQSGTHTAITNPLHIHIHPCPRFTCRGNSGVQTITDLNGAIDEPLYSRFARSYVGRQPSTSQPNYVAPGGRIWGNLVSMTVNVLQAATATAGSVTVAITCPGFTQPNLTSSPFSQTIDLTVAGTRTVTPSGVTGSVGVDALVAYGDWLSSIGPKAAAYSNILKFTFTGMPAVLSNCSIISVQILTDQGITKFITMHGEDNESYADTWTDSSIQNYWPTAA